MDPPNDHLISQSCQIRDWLHTVYERARSGDPKANDWIKEFYTLMESQQKQDNPLALPVVKFVAHKPLPEQETGSDVLLSGSKRLFNPRRRTSNKTTVESQLMEQSAAEAEPERESGHVINHCKNENPIGAIPVKFGHHAAPEVIEQVGTRIQISAQLFDELCVPAPKSGQGILKGALVSTMTPDEVNCRVRCIRQLSPRPIHNLEVYYLLVLADVFWEWEQELLPGHVLYIPSAIRDIIGKGAPSPPGLAGEQMCEEMQRRAFAIAGEVGLVFAQGVDIRFAHGDLCNQDVTQVCGPDVIQAAIHGISGMRDAMRALNPSVAQIMMHPEYSSDQLMRHFREYLDVRAAAMGYPLRPDIDGYTRHGRHDATQLGHQKSGFGSAQIN